MINVVDGEYGATANTLQQVSGELQGAKIDDLSEAVESSMKGADSISKATEVEGRYTSLLVTHSTALEELARAAHAAGVNLAQTEADNTQQANAQGRLLLQEQRERPQVWHDMLNKHRRSMALQEVRCAMDIWGQPCRRRRVVLNLKCPYTGPVRECRLMRQLLLYQVLFLTQRPLLLLWHSEARGLKAEQWR